MQVNRKLYIFFAIIIIAVICGCSTPVNDNSVDIIGWGLIYSNGTIGKGSGNYSCNKTAIGNYTISWNNALLTAYDSYIFTAIPYTTAQNIDITYATGNGGADVYFRVFNSTSGAATDCAFNFSVMSQ